MMVAMTGMQRDIDWAAAMDCPLEPYWAYMKDYCLAALLAGSMDHLMAHWTAD